MNNRALLVLALLAAVGSGQWIEKTISVPGSIPGTWYDAMLYHPANGNIYCGDNGNSSLLVIDGDADSVVKEIAVPVGINSLAYDPNTGHLYASSAGGNTPLSVIDCATDSVIKTLAIGPFSQSACYNSHDGKVYFESCGNCTVYVVDCATDSIIARPRLASAAYRICYEPLHNKVYCACCWDPPSLTVIDGAADTVIKRLTGLGTPNAVCFNPDDGLVYVSGGSSNSIILIDGANDSVVANIAVGGWTRDICVNPLENKAYAIIDIYQDSGRVAVVDIAGRRLIKTLPLGMSPTRCIYNPQDNKVFCTNGGYTDTDSTVSVIDGRSDSLLMTVVTGRSPFAMVHNPLRNRVYVANKRSASITVLCDSITVGVVERPRPQGPDREPGSTVVRGVLRLAKSTSSSPGTSCLLDICGQKVMELRAGDNDVRSLASGLYFVHVTGSSHAAKVVVQR